MPQWCVVRSGSDTDAGLAGACVDDYLVTEPISGRGWSCPNEGRIAMTQDTPRHRILLVEDEAMVAMLIEDMLEDLGHELVKVASRLEDALAAAKDEAIDLAILDLNLAGVLTYPAADVLKARGIPFIFSTGYGSTGLKGAYSSHLALQKPFDQQALGQAIKGAVAPNH
jgi:CheY-like chemotaxis protein